MSHWRQWWSSSRIGEAPSYGAEVVPVRPQTVSLCGEDSTVAAKLQGVPGEVLPENVRECGSCTHTETQN